MNEVCLNTQLYSAVQVSIDNKSSIAWRTIDGWKVRQKTVFFKSRYFMFNILHSTEDFWCNSSSTTTGIYRFFLISSKHTKKFQFSLKLKNGTRHKPNDNYRYYSSWSLSKH
jgi:hypothetical protein